jgi:hypothetical protein
MTKQADTNNTPVALQQRFSDGVRKYAELTNKQLHTKMLEIRSDFFNRCVETQTYGVDILLPACEEIITRFRMPGMKAKNRPNGKPTVEAYFRSIKLNYNTVRSWIHRKRLSTEMFDLEKTASNNKDGKVPHLTQLEARLIGGVSAAHDLVKAIKQRGNVDEAIKEFEEHAPSPSQIEEYIEHPVGITAVTEKLVIRLCRMIDRNDSKQEQKILALARELLAKVEPITVHQVLDDERKRPRREEVRKASARRAA